MIFNELNEGSRYRLPTLRRRRDQRARLGDPLAVTSGLIGADVEAGAATVGPIFRPVIVGVCTGVSVWLVTRILDRIFGIEKRK